MRKICNLNCKFLYDIDLFGKEAELYYKGKSKRTSWFGTVFTITYIILYFSFFLYKLIRMLQKVDVTFYDTYAFTGEPPHIKLNKNKFYGGFALGDVYTLQTFVDDTIYYVKAYYKRGKKEGNVWNWETIPLEIETCKLESFGEKYRDIFKDKSINNLHCVNVLNHTLQGHLTYDVYSYYYVRFFPCINNTQNNYHCKPLSVIKKYLTQTFVTFKMEDIDLTPQLYTSPVALRGKEVSANVGKTLFKDVHSFFQVINIETDEDILGLEFFSKIKKEKYIKYDQSVILSSLKTNDIFETGEAICDITIALSEQELTQKRTYPKLIEVMGDVGGLMEVIFSFFRIISIYLTDTLYEASLVNHLFSFDLERKALIIKEKKKRNKHFFLKEDSPKIYTPLKQNSLQNSVCLNDDININKKDILNDGSLIKTKITNEIIIGSGIRKRRKRKIKSKISYQQNKNDESKKKNINDIVNLKQSNINNNINLIDSSIKISNINKEKERNLEAETKKEKYKEKNPEIIIDKIKLNKMCIYLCFCCVRKRRNLQNILLDEGMKIIIENLDIMNLFRNLHRFEKMRDKNNTKDDVIEMSEECKKNLKYINSNILHFN